MLSKILFLLCVASLAAGCSSVFGPSCDRPTWVDTTMTVTGVGFPSESNSNGQQKIMAERASRISAISTMMIQIQNLPYNETSRVGEYLPTDWGLNGFSVDDVQHHSDGSCYTKISLPLSHVWDTIQKNRK